MKPRPVQVNLRRILKFYFVFKQTRHTISERNSMPGLQNTTNFQSTFYSNFHPHQFGGWYRGNQVYLSFLKS
jgi:hypothetical protein